MELRRIDIINLEDLDCHPIHETWEKAHQGDDLKKERIDIEDKGHRKFGVLGVGTFAAIGSLFLSGPTGAIGFAVIGVLGFLFLYGIEAYELGTLEHREAHSLREQLILNNVHMTPCHFLYETVDSFNDFARDANKTLDLIDLGLEGKQPGIETLVADAEEHIKTLLGLDRLLYRLYNESLNSPLDNRAQLAAAQRLDAASKIREVKYWMNDARNRFNLADES